MLVVADSSPLIVLISIGQAGILPTLFGQVFVPPEVIAELRAPARPAQVRTFVTPGPSWLVEKAPVAVENIPLLHAGELAAISLARELKADLLLIDEQRGRKAATERHIAITGTVGLLELGARRGLLDLAAAFAAIKQTDFWISPKLLDERLKRFGAS